MIAGSARHGTAWLRCLFAETDTTVMAAFRFIAIWASVAGAVGTAFFAVVSQFPVIPPWVATLMLAAAQWALLRVRVSWAVRWAAGTAASPVLLTVAAPLLAALFPEGPGSSPISPYVAVIRLL